MAPYPWRHSSPLVPEQASFRSTFRQVLQRINRFALAANLEVQLHPVGSSRSHLGNALPSFDLLAFLNQQPAVVTVGAYIGIAVLDDHKFAVTP